MPAKTFIRKYSLKSRKILLQIILLATLAAPLTAGNLNASNIDDNRLQAAKADQNNWLTYGRDYSNQRFSPLTAINKSNIKNLKPKWIYETGIKATFQTSPIIADGVMYISTPFAHVVALEAGTGKEIWRYKHIRKEKRLCCGPANRGVAIGYGLIFIAALDARLIALDQKTGEVVWDVPLAVHGDELTENKAQLKNDKLRPKTKVTGSTGVGANMAPLVYDGKVFVGITGVGFGLHLESEREGAPIGTVYGFAGKYGRSGFMAAFDAKTGKRLWQFNSTKQNWEGDYAKKTAYGLDLPRDIVAEKIAASKYKNAWKYGGGSIWHAPAVDLERGLLFFGIGNPSPQAAGETRPGDNLYTMSLVAVKADTGKIVWHYQQVPHDIWGYDVASPPSLFNVKIDGKTIPAVGQASKLGWYFVHDRKDGKLLFKSPPLIPQENLFKRPTEKGIRITPGPGGGTSWSPVSVDEQRGLAFVASMHMPFFYERKNIPATKDKPAIPYYVFAPTEEPRFGTLSAVDLKNKGQLAWQVKTEQPLVGGVLATKSGLVFTGEGNGNFSAFDAENGKQLWTFNCGPGVNAPPVTFAIDGKEYISVAAGGSKIWGFPTGDKVYVFALDE